MEWVNVILAMGGVAGAIGGPAVGVVALRGARAEGREGRAHALALAHEQHAQELDRVRRARLFERRAATYEATLRYVIWREETALRTNKPVVTSEKPQEPDPEVDWWGLAAQLSVFGTQDAYDAVVEFSSRVRTFDVAAGTWRQLADVTRENQGPSEPVLDAHAAMETAREAVTHQAEGVARLVRDELAAL